MHEARNKVPFFLGDLAPTPQYDDGVRHALVVNVPSRVLAILAQRLGSSMVTVVSVAAADEDGLVLLRAYLHHFCRLTGVPRVGVADAAVLRTHLGERLAPQDVYRILLKRKFRSP